MIKGAQAPFIMALNISTQRTKSNMEFKTSDIVLASALKTSGFTLADIEIVGSRGVFVFNNVTPEFLNDFDLGEVRVEPNQLHQAVKQLTTAVRRKTT